MRGSIAKSLRRRAREEAQYFDTGNGRKYMKGKRKEEDDAGFIVLHPNSQRGIFKRLKREVKRGDRPKHR